MKFDTPAGPNVTDRQVVIGQPVDRVDGALKTTGTARYAYENQDVGGPPAYGVIVGAAIAKGRIESMDLTAAEASSGVLAIVTADNAGKLGVGGFYVDRALAGPDVDHYHQAVAVVVAETFEQARAAANLVQVRYAPGSGAFDLAAEAARATAPDPAKVRSPAHTEVGDFEGAFAAAPFKLDAHYRTPDQAHAMMEPHATIASWSGNQLTCWCTVQLVAWGKRDLGMILGIPPDNIRLITPYIGGGFGGKGTAASDLVMASLAARAAGRPVKVALQRTLMFNNTTHRPATMQRIRIGASADGRITAIGHESLSGNLPGGSLETATAATKLLYAGANRMTDLKIAVLDLAEGNAMRAPGEASGMMALEIAIDEMAETIGMDPVQFRIVNDTQVDPANPDRPFSTRKLIECLTTGAAQFGWSHRQAKPGQVREGRWRIGLGVAAAIRGAPITTSAARVRLDAQGHVTVETDMTDIGTGSYTILAQTAAEMLGVGVDRVTVRLGDSTFPVSSGSGGQWGAASATSGVYAACVTLRERITAALEFDAGSATFADVTVTDGARSAPLHAAAQGGELVAEEAMTYGDLAQRFAQQTFGAHFVEVAVDAATGEVRVRRMLAVCHAGRILNPKLARSQVIGSMTMGVGAALMEDMVVDTRLGFFVNHDLAGYEVPVHADIPHQDVVFLDDEDPTMSPMKAMGVGELGICGVGAAIANAVYNATGVRVRDYPVTLDKILEGLPAV